MRNKTTAFLLVGVISLQVACRPDETEPRTDLEIEVEDMTQPTTSDMTTPSTMPDMADMADMQTTPVDDDMSSDMDAVDMPDDDMGEPVDMETTPPIREVVDYSMMGNMKIRNYVKDPLFATLNQDYMWYVTNRNMTQLISEVYRHVPASTPENAPALKVAKDSFLGVSVIGEVLFHKDVPMTVSVWIGREGFVLGDTSPPPEVRAIGVNLQDLEDLYGLPLQADSSSTVVENGYSWTKYEVNVQDFAGYGYLWISDRSERDLYIHAPQVTEYQALPTGLVMPMASSTPLSKTDSANIARMIKTVSDKRAVPPQASSEGPTPHPF